MDVESVINAANTFYKGITGDPNGRYRSWEHCYKCFKDERGKSDPQYDYLSLQLAFYLASWGMYRGSSFLLQKDYKVHTPVVEELLKKDYDCLLGIDCSEYLQNTATQNALNNLSRFLEDYYNDVRKSVKGADITSKVSDTLVTKVLMGTLGCVPAYDRYFIKGIKVTGLSTGNYNQTSLMELAKFYFKNSDRLEVARQNFKVGALLYPQMKLLDMGFWQIGLETENGNK